MQRRDVLSKVSGTVAGLGAIGAVSGTVAAQSWTVKDSMYRATRRGYDLRLESEIDVVLGSNNCGDEGGIYMSASVDILPYDGNEYEGEITIETSDVYDPGSNETEFDVNYTHHGDSVDLSRSDTNYVTGTATTTLDHYVTIEMEDGYSTNLYTEASENTSC